MKYGDHFLSMRRNGHMVKNICPSLISPYILALLIHQMISVKRNKLKTPKNRPGRLLYNAYQYMMDHRSFDLHYWAIPFFVRPPSMEGRGFPAGFFAPDPYGRVWILFSKLRYHLQRLWNSSRIFPREMVQKGLDFRKTLFFNNDIHRVFPWIFLLTRGTFHR